MNHKHPLNREELQDVIDLSLWAGQLLLNSGAESQRVEETVHYLGTGLGCDWMDILVSPNVIIATTTSGDEFRTKVRRVVGMSVNMSILTAINAMSHRVNAGKMDRFAVRDRLAAIDQMPRQYNRWLVVIMVGLACGAFSQLFGGNLESFLVTIGASSTAMAIRQELTHRYLNPYLVIMVTAFVAGTVVGVLRRLGALDDASIALSASVLQLVPGVPLINSAEDLLKGHNVTGVTRAIIGGLISLTIALGLLFAIALTGISGL